MKILHILPFCLFPQDAGNKKNTLKLINYQLKCNHEVGVIYIGYGMGYQSNNSTKKFLEYTQLSSEIGYGLFGICKKLINRLAFVIGRFSINPLYLLSHKDKEKIRDSVKFNQYDAIIIHYAVLSSVLDLIDLKSIKTILFTHDLIFIRDRYRKFPKYIRRIKEEVELKILNKFDQVLVVSSEEYNCLLEKGFPQKKLILSGSSHDIIDSRNGKKKYDLLFVGAIGNEPNLEGLNWFLQNVWPSVIKDLPNLSLAVAGSICNAGFVSSISSPGIFKLGFVEDLVEVYSQSRVVIVPLFSGSGVKIKLVEAMAHCKPVISTSIGAEGLNLDPNKDFLLAEDVLEWNLSIKKLITSKSKRRKYENASYEWAVVNATDENVWGELNDSLSKLVCERKC